MSESQTIDEFFKNSAQTEKLIISLSEWKGQKYIDFRWWYLPEGEKGFKPTKKGVSINTYHLDRLKKAIDKAVKLTEGGK